MKKGYKIAIGLCLVLVVILGFFYFKFQPAQSYEWGITFSYLEAQGLGFDWKTMYLDILSDLKPKHIRLMTYWKDIEKEKGKFDFTIADEMLIEAQKQNVDVLLVVGRKQPRWPECHEPGWYKDLSSAERDQAVLDFVKNSVEHFRQFTAIRAWQVENEPYFGFGDNCPTIGSDLFRKEVALVKSLDARPVLATDSGDRGAWIPVSRTGAEAFGFTLYRTSYDDTYGGYYKYPIPPVFYRIRSGMLISLAPIREIWDVELQMEPWFTNGALNTPLDTQKTLMNAKVFKQNIEYAKKTQIGRHYLWGTEWWYWMAKKNNDWGMWEEAKKLLR